MIRVASLRDMVHAKYQKPDIAGLTPGRQLELLSVAIHQLVELQYSNNLCMFRSMISSRKITLRIFPSAGSSTTRLRTLGTCTVANWPLDLTVLMKMYGLEGFDHLKAAKYTPQPVPQLPPGCRIFDEIRKGDILLHHPYQTFAPVVEFIRPDAVLLPAHHQRDLAVGLQPHQPVDDMASRLLQHPSPDDIVLLVGRRRRPRQGGRPASSPR